MSSPPPPSTDPNSGYCLETKTYFSLRPPLRLPHQTHLSLTSYVFSLLPSPLPSHPAFILEPPVGGGGASYLSYPDLVQRSQTLASNLRSLYPNATSAFILSPSSLHLPVLYFALLSLPITLSPSNPLSSPSDISRQIRLSRPSIFFATSSTAPSLPSSLSSPPILLDSPFFLSLTTSPPLSNAKPIPPVSQSHTAAVLYSSGTTGNIKGVAISHRNLIAIAAGFDSRRVEREQGPAVSLFTIPLFHVFGFIFALGTVAVAQTVVLLQRFDFLAMLRAIQRWRVNYMPVSPPLVVALSKSDEVRKYDLSSLEVVGSGGAPLGKDVAERFKARFPNVEIVQGYGLTESTGAASRTVGPEESQHFGSTGRLTESMEAKIVDPDTGEALPPGQKGELWLRGPQVMKGYVGDNEATAAALDSEGWLKTGDLCYFDHEGFLFIVDRLKELIKYKGYQVPPAELEQLLLSHPEIADAAVIPYPDEGAGQIPMAYVVRKTGSNINAQLVMDFIAKQVAPYKKIRRVTFTNSIPKSPAGKILRRELISHAISSSSSKL